MSNSELSTELLAAVEQELRHAVGKVQDPLQEGLHVMLAYHMGWEGEGAGLAARGKRIRPLLVLLTCAACETGWAEALPAAAAVELVHNFSLIHDDIEDNSLLRRGRPTLWMKWGIPQAINAGDAMLTLAHLALLRLAETTDVLITSEAVKILQQACLHLTQGQYLDIAFEESNSHSLESYWPMISGKTAALISACTEIGALVGQANPERRTAWREFGKYLGMAFQARDDLLGIWGKSEKTGKSAQSDLLSGKKTLPVLFGLSQNGAFARRWLQGPIAAEEVRSIAELLKSEGALDYTEFIAHRLTTQALENLDRAEPAGEAGMELHELVKILLQRDS